jgi:hypothetical protein
MSTDLTELDWRLRRLAPEIDLEEARAEQRARQARSARLRRQLGGLLAAACVVVVAGAVAAVQVLGDRAERGNDVATANVGLRTTTAEIDGVELSVTAPAQATAGTRMWFDVVVRNHGDAPAYVETSTSLCSSPVHAVAGPSSTTTGPGDQPVAEPARWNGDVDELAALLAAHDTLPPTLPHQGETVSGTRAVSCPAGPRTEPLEPGGELRQRGSFELRLPPGGVPDDGDYVLVAELARWKEAGLAPTGGQLPAVEVRAPLTVTDDVGRLPGSSDAAGAAFAADPRLAEWVAAGRIAGGSDAGRHFHVELGWWRGAWELWVTPDTGGLRSLRLRYDPARDEVTDIRSVSAGQVPEDEPDRAAVPGDQPDEILCSEGVDATDGAEGTDGPVTSC